MVNNINANFQKVFTLPFLKGDDGDRLTTRFCPFWEKPEGATDSILTEEGYKIFKTIFCRVFNVVLSIFTTLSAFILRPLILLFQKAQKAKRQ
jgi:hypothetical protein